MIRKLFAAGLAALILANVADACFFKKRARAVPVETLYLPSESVPQVAVVPRALNDLSIISVAGQTPLNGAIPNPIAVADTTVIAQTNYNTGMDVFDLELTDQGPKTVLKKAQSKHYKPYKIVPDAVEGVYAGGAKVYFLIPGTDLTASEKYSLLVSDTTKAINSSSVTFTTAP